jgi:hypothetical protein
MVLRPAATHDREVDRWHRWLAASWLVFFGLIAARLTSGQFPGCLGPLGVTHVECIAASGIAPTDWFGPPMAVLAFAAAWLTVRPLPRRHWRRVVVAGLVGFLVGEVAYFAIRTRMIEGPTSTGHWAVVTLPPDGYAMLASALGVGLAFAIGAQLAGRSHAARRL